MERSIKAFVIASLVWLVVGAVFGTLLAFGASAEYVAFRFAHMHLLLLGFMAMMVYGVGYFILPRFNGTTLRWPRLVDVHFWTANGGLLGLVFADPRFRPLFAVISLAGVLLFAVNLIVTLLAAPSVQQRLAGKTAAAAGAGATDAAPDDGEAEAGDGAVTLAGGGVAGRATSAPLAPRIDSAAGGGSAGIRGDETVGELLAAHPQLEEAIRLFFGDGCFTCPGQSTETIVQAALVHNIDPDLLLAELRKRL